MFRRSSFLGAWCLLLSSVLAAPVFQDKLVFTDAACAKTGECTLASNFSFVDSTGVGWQAAAGNVTNGASIPPKLRPYIGYPFDADLIRAAVIHDHYCDRHVRSWRDTHWAFYDALLASGVEHKRAKRMYAGVLLGGPKWFWTIVGRDCTGAVGKVCVQQAGYKPLPSGSVKSKDADGKDIILRAARYDSAEFPAELDTASAEIDLLPAAAGRVEIEALVKKIRPRDDFLHGPDIVARPKPSGVDK